MQRIDAIKALSKLVNTEDLFVSSIGNLWDDWWNYRPGGQNNTFSPAILGSVSSTALGLALALPHRRIVAMETDGSMLMNTGIMCTLGNERPPNLTVIVFDNGLYENIGGMPTHSSRNTDFAKMAAGAGCINTVTVSDVASFEREVGRLLTDNEFGFAVARILPGQYPWPWEKRKPTDGVEDKYLFIRHIEQLEGIVVHPGAPQN